MSVRRLLSGILALLGLASAAPAQSFPIPADAALFARLDLSEAWQSPTAKALLETVAKADPALLLDFQKRFPVTPLDIEGITMFAFPQKPETPKAYMLIHLKKDVEPATVMPLIDPHAETKQTGGKAYFASQESGVEIRFVDKRTVMVCAPGCTTFLANHKEGTGGLSEIIKKNEKATGFFLAADISYLPPGLLQDVPLEFAPIAAVKTLEVSMDFKASKLDVKLHYADESATKEAHAAILKGLAKGREELAKGKQDMLQSLAKNRRNDAGGLEEMVQSGAVLLASGGMNQLDEYLANPGLTVSGKTIGKSVVVPDTMGMNAATMPIMIGLLLPAVQKVRAAAGQAKGANNMKQLMLAMMNYESAYQHLPGDICDKNGKPLLSWRVAILPFIEQNALYKEFKLDEPWDSEHNLPLSKIIVKTFKSPNDTEPNGKTRYQVFTGKGTCFEPGKNLKIANITDGTSNTGMIFEAKDSVEWTKPGDMPYDPKMDVASKLWFPDGTTTMLAMCDGSVRSVSKKIAASTWHALITPAGGEILDLDREEGPAPPNVQRKDVPPAKKGN